MSSRGAKVRLADVATRAQVSEATVSRVLNDRPGVSPTVRRAVLFALEELGYRRLSRSRHQSDGLIGLVIPELDNPTFAVLAQAIETHLARNGYTPVLCTLTPTGVDEDEYVRMLLERRVSGIVFVSAGHANIETPSDRYQNLRSDGVPIVLVNGHRPEVDAAAVSVDDTAGIRMAVAHLASLGHVRIGLAIGPERYLPVQRKVAAFATAMRLELGSEALQGASWGDLEQMVVHSVFGLDGGKVAADALLDRGATAIITGSDVMALGVLHAAQERDLRVPQDVSVVGSDGIQFGEFVHPPLTTVQSPLLAMAEAAARALLDEIEGKPMPRAEYLFQPELTIRGSTADRS